jgi:hypothetical protein
MSGIRQANLHVWLWGSISSVDEKLIERSTLVDHFCIEKCSTFSLIYLSQFIGNDPVLFIQLLRLSRYLWVLAFSWKEIEVSNSAIIKFIIGFPSYEVWFFAYFEFDILFSFYERSQINSDLRKYETQSSELNAISHHDSRKDHQIDHFSLYSDSASIERCFWIWISLLATICSDTFFQRKRKIEFWSKNWILRGCVFHTSSDISIESSSHDRFQVKFDRVNPHIRPQFHVNH